MTAGRKRGAGEEEAAERGRKDVKNRAVMEGERKSLLCGERSANLVRENEQIDNLTRGMRAAYKGFPTPKHRWMFQLFHLQNITHLFFWILSHLISFWWCTVLKERQMMSSSSEGCWRARRERVVGEWRGGRGTRKEIGERGGGERKGGGEMKWGKKWLHGHDRTAPFLPLSLSQYLNFFFPPSSLLCLLLLLLCVCVSFF